MKHERRAKIAHGCSASCDFARSRCLGQARIPAILAECRVAPSVELSCGQSVEHFIWRRPVAVRATDSGKTNLAVLADHERRCNTCRVFSLSILGGERFRRETKAINRKAVVR
jgi:hypothetical protein